MKAPKNDEIVFYQGSIIGIKRLNHRLYLIGPMPDGYPDLQRCKEIMWFKNAKKVIRNQFYTKEMDKEWSKFCWKKSMANKKLKIIG